MFNISRYVCFFSYFCREKQITMESKAEDILLKIRSYRSIVNIAFRLYTKSFWQLLRKQWPLLILVAILYWVAVMLTVYDLYVFVPIVILAVIAELLLWWHTGSWLTQRSMKRMLRPARRHFWRLLACAVIGVIALLPLCALVSLPPSILVLAEWESQNSQLMGDAPAMPSYVLYLTGATWFVSLLLQVCIRLYLVFVAYYSWGSGEARLQERQAQLAQLSSTL